MTQFHALNSKSDAREFVFNDLGITLTSIRATFRRKRSVSERDVI